jgi:hypothetical protein
MMMELLGRGCPARFSYHFSKGHGVPCPGRPRGVACTDDFEDNESGTRIAELGCRIGIARGDVHESNDIENIRLAAAIGVSQFNFRALREWIRINCTIAKCNIDRLYHIEDIGVAITLRIGEALAVTEDGWCAVTDCITLDTVGVRESTEYVITVD